MTRAFSSEVALGRAFIPNLKRRGMLAFPEVPIPGVVDRHGDALIPDLIAVSPREGILEVFELKLHAGVDLVADAARWTPYAHRSWGVAPWVSQDRRESPAFVEACKAFKKAGAGLILVKENGALWRAVPPKFNPDCADIGIREALEHAPRGGYAEAGSPGSAKRATKTAARNDELAAKLLELIETRPKIRATVALVKIGATPAFTSALRRGTIAGIELAPRNRLVRKAA